MRCLLHWPMLQRRETLRLFKDFFDEEQKSTMLIMTNELFLLWFVILPKL